MIVSTGLQSLKAAEWGGERSRVTCGEERIGDEGVNKVVAAAPGGTNADDLMEYGRPTCNATTGRQLYVLALKVARRGPGERGSEERGYCTDFFLNIFLILCVATFNFMNRGYAPSPPRPERYTHRRRGRASYGMLYARRPMHPTRDAESLKMLPSPCPAHLPMPPSPRNPSQPKLLFAICSRLAPNDGPSYGRRRCSYCFWCSVYCSLGCSLPLST